MGILEKMKLDGKKGFVTGGARGIGKAAAIALAEAGADVAIVDVDLEEARRTAEWIAKETGRDCFAIQTDVTKPLDVDLMITSMLERFQKLDYALCNAGICLNVAAEEMTYEQFQKVIDVNLMGVFLTAQAAGKVMLRQGFGSIITTASMSGHIVNVPQPQCSYNASKAAVIMLTKSMAVEWAKRNVRVNSIRPGYIATTLIPLIEKWNALSPVGRMGKPEELQSIIVYLAGDTSTFTTGSDFVVDGAFSAF